MDEKAIAAIVGQVMAATENKSDKPADASAPEPAAPAAQPKPAPTPPDIDYARIGEEVAKALRANSEDIGSASPEQAASFVDALRAAATGEQRYEAPGAPSGAPREVGMDAFAWTRDDIDRMDKDGTLLSNVEKWRSQWEDGGSTLFRKRIPKG